MDTLENAQARAEYWKAEHNAANAEIDRLKATVARVETVTAEFEGMTGSGYRYMAAHIRDAIKVPNAEVTSRHCGQTINE